MKDFELVAVVGAALIVLALLGGLAVWLWALVLFFGWLIS